MSYLLHCLGIAFSGEILPLWLTFIAEIGVVWVIWRESETTRRNHFIETTTRDERNQERATIYAAYLEIKEPDFEQRSRLLVAKMHADTQDFKRQCDRQIELFNGLGLIISPWFTRKKTYVRIFPHAAIYMWIILRPYITQRRMDAGTFFAEPMLKFMLACAEFLIKENRPLRIRHPQGADELTISVAHLQLVRQQLKAELDNPLRPFAEQS